MITLQQAGELAMRYVLVVQQHQNGERVVLNVDAGLLPILASVKNKEYFSVEFSGGKGLISGRLVLPAEHRIAVAENDPISINPVYSAAKYEITLYVDKVRKSRRK